MLLNVTYRNTAVQKFAFKRKTAAYEERYKVVAPKLLYAVIFAGHNTLFIYSVFGNVRCDIAVLCNLFKIRVSNVRYLKYGAGLRISLRKQKKVVCKLLRQYCEIGLSIAEAHSRCLTRYFFISYQFSDFIRSHMC